MENQLEFRVLGAADVGAPHKRERIWIVAHAVSQCDRGEINGCEVDRAQAERSASGAGRSGDGGAEDVANASSRRLSEPGEWKMEQPGRTEVVGASALSDSNGQRTHRGGSWPKQDGGDESTDDGASADGLADANCLRELQPQGDERKERGRPCNGCGYEFDHELLGRYGCHNCEGENISDCDCDCVQGLEPEPQPGGYGRPAGLRDRAGGVHAGAGCAAHAPVTGLGRAADGLAQRLDKLAAPWIGDWEGNTPRVASGVAHRSHRLKAIGNGQVSLCAATAFNLLKP